MKKLLVVISSMTFGGAEIQTLELANALVALDYNIDIIVLDHKQEIIPLGHRSIRFHVMNKQKYLDVSVVKRIRRMVMQNRPDLILCVELYPTLYLQLAMAGLKEKHKIVTVMHSTLPRDRKEMFQHFYLTPFLKKVDQTVFVSHQQKDYWSKKHRINPEKSVTIHNGIHIDIFSEYLNEHEKIQLDKTRFGFSQQDVVLGTCASFRIEKRHKDLVEAIYRLKSKGYKVKLLLIGDGEMRTKLEEQIEQLALQEDVRITGHVMDVRPYLALIDIFVLSSVSVETLSLAAIESQAMKKAAILSSIGGAAEIVQDGINGYLYTAGNVEELTEKAEMMMKDKKWKAMGKAAYQHATHCFSHEKMTMAYDHLFKELMASR